MSRTKLAFGRTLLGVATIMLPAAPALADFHLCNKTESRIGVAIGYQDAERGWVTEGWWNLPARSCETMLKGAPAARSYYLHAIDYDRGGEWAGQTFMCTREREFTILGADNCLTRGFDRTGFYEVETSARTRDLDPNQRGDTNMNDIDAIIVDRP